MVVLIHQVDFEVLRTQDAALFSVGTFCLILQKLGRLAQLGERRVRNAEAEGSNPLPSTKGQEKPRRKPGFFLRRTGAPKTAAKGFPSGSLESKNYVAKSLHRLNTQNPSRPPFSKGRGWSPPPFRRGTGGDFSGRPAQTIGRTAVTGHQSNGFERPWLAHPPWLFTMRERALTTSGLYRVPDMAESSARAVSLVFGVL